MCLTSLQLLSPICNVLSCHSRSKPLFFNLKMVPLPPHPCVSLTSAPTTLRRNSCRGGPPLISCLISWMNNVPFPGSSGLAAGPQRSRLMTALRAKTAVGGEMGCSGAHVGETDPPPLPFWRPQPQGTSSHRLPDRHTSTPRETEVLQTWVLLFRNGDCL